MIRRIGSVLRAVRRFAAGGLVAAVAVPVSLFATASPAQAASCNLTTGPYQRAVEKYLGRPVDGRQSAADCRAIKAFQIRYNVTPTQGYAGPKTWSKIQLLQAGSNPNRAGTCPTNRGRIACVDLGRQLMWVQDGRALKFGPKVVRTGRNGYETRTGSYKIYWRNIDHYSTIYHVPMPYAQFFSGGQAFHAISGDIYSAPGSHGCVNMTTPDARKLWSLLRNNDDVYVYGRKPGT
jgi:lipoprotein-anchoring transpeptidase ErfK/SrfK